MNIDVLYVTYARDAKWFRYSLKVIQKNLIGHRRILVVCPEQDQLEIMGDHTYPDITFYPIPDWPGMGYHWQQWVKMNADQYSDADLICHIDSDVFIGKPTKIEDFFTDGKPSWLWAYYTDLPTNPPASKWQEPTQKATGRECPREFMQGFPFIIHREHYKSVRTALEFLHDRSLDALLKEKAEEGISSFSEFNVIGRILWDIQQDKYHWLDRNREKWPAGFYNSHHFWSYGGIDEHKPAIMAMLQEGGNEHTIRTTDMGIWVIANDTHISKWIEDQKRLDFDEPFMKKICKYIQPGDTVVDIGAFNGDSTEAFAKAVLGHTNGRVLAFEPNPAAYSCLVKNMAGHGHVTCIEAGLGAASGTMDLMPDQNAGATYLIPGGRIPVNTLDSYEIITRCELIKIDAEGMEMHILMGGYKTITSFRPVIVMEINRGALARNGVMQEDIFNWLRLRGYVIEGYVDQSQFDIFAIPDGHATN